MKGDTEFAAGLFGVMILMLQDKFTDKEILRMLKRKNLQGMLEVMKPHRDKPNNGVENE